MKLEEEIDVRRMLDHIIDQSLDCQQDICSGAI